MLNQNENVCVCRITLLSVDGRVSALKFVSLEALGDL
jgi:hypothetical protein